MSRLKARWADLSGSLAFVPGVMVALFAVLGVGLVELDRRLDVTAGSFVFAGDASAARTVLSVIAGSLITVAGLTFSITMVALQLTSSQFSPRILRTFFADRVTQITIGAFVGTFVYALLVLRSVGGAPVPRVSVTVASGLGIAAVILLVAFLHHVAQLIQVSHITAAIAHDALRRMNALYPERYGRGEAGDDRLEHWRREPSDRVFPSRPGYVRRLDIDALAAAADGRARRVAILVCPGDLVSVDMPILELWPADGAPAGALAEAVEIDSERDLDQDIDFALRQLTDTALKAMSPGINDPATAVTCIAYLRSILVRLAERDLAASVRRFPGRELTIQARRRGYGEYLDALLQINRCLDGDAWVAGELLRALEGCAAAAARCGAGDRARQCVEVARTVADQSAREAGNDVDRAAAGPRLEAVIAAARPAGRPA